MYRDSVRLDSKAADGWVDGGKHCGGFEHGGNEQLAPANDSDSARKISILFDARCIPSSSSSTATLSSYLTQTSPIFSADIGSVGGRQSLSVSHSLQLDRNWQDVRRNLKISDPTSRGARGEVVGKRGGAAAMQGSEVHREDLERGTLWVQETSWKICSGTADVAGVSNLKFEGCPLALRRVSVLVSFQTPKPSAGPSLSIPPIATRRRSYGRITSIIQHAPTCGVSVLLRWRDGSKPRCEDGNGRGEPLANHDTVSAEDHTSERIYTSRWRRSGFSRYSKVSHWTLYRFSLHVVDR
ncbi:hypothetical protein C8R46DRAFT_1026546 [Mycena filopes]|nr:hypothetical protein C8R46DRAFT_1026546 [Mycena filopes]